MSEEKSLIVGEDTMEGGEGGEQQPMEQLNGQFGQLFIQSMSDEQLYNRCAQNSHLLLSSNQKEKGVKKAYPEVFIPEEFFPDLVNNSALRCYLIPYSLAEQNDMRNPNVLKDLDIDGWVRSNGFYAFPIISVNKNPVPLSFKFPQRNTAGFKSEDRTYGILMMIEGPNGINLKGISPSFRLSVKIEQFLNKSAAQERIRRHTKPKKNSLRKVVAATEYDQQAASLLDLSRVNHHNLEPTNSAIMQILNNCPNEALPDLVEFLEYQTSQLRKKLTESPSKRLKVHDESDQSFNIEEQEQV